MENHVPMLGISQGTKSRIPKAPSGILRGHQEGSSRHKEGSSRHKEGSSRQVWGGSRLFPRHDQVGL